MDTTTGLTCKAGDEVRSSDDQKLGKVIAFDNQFLTVEHGLLSKSRYTIPVSAVNSCGDGEVYLNVSKDQATSGVWESPSMTSGDMAPPL